ncbi:MAG: hypothetical protein PHI02_06365 [Sulfurovaceae bacterium]|nr:hypothetical protein [Sulfurovaceae bacterium]
MNKEKESKTEIESFEEELYRILQRPFVVEYLSLYKHKRIKIKEDPFYSDGSTIAWVIEATFEKAINKILSLDFV